MKKKVLLATLGESPAVVTEAIDKLQDNGIKIDVVTVLTTSDSSAQEAVDLLSEHIPAHYQHSVEFHGPAGIVEAYDDVDSDQAAMEFMNLACSALRKYRQRRWEVYACIAGGRKTMAALMGLAVQFYGATMLFQVLVEDREIEEGGRISRLRNLPKAKQDRYLHPQVDQVKLIRLPFIGLFPLISDIIGGLRGQQGPPEVQRLLEENGLRQAGELTDFGKMVLQVLESVETLPEPREDECEKKLEVHSKDAKLTRDWADRIAKRFSFVTRIEDIRWSEKEPQVKPEPPNRLILSVPGREVRAISFRLTTTAQTVGQLQRAAEEIDRWLKKEVR